MVSERRKHLSYLERPLSFGSQFPRGIVEMEVRSF